MEGDFSLRIQICTFFEAGNIALWLKARREDGKSFGMDPVDSRQNTKHNLCFFFIDSSKR